MNKLYVIEPFVLPTLRYARAEDEEEEGEQQCETQHGITRVGLILQ